MKMVRMRTPVGGLTNFDTVPLELRPGVFRIGGREGPPDVRMLVGYCVFGSSDAALLVSLLPQLVHVRGEQRLNHPRPARGRGITWHPSCARGHPGAPARGSADRGPSLHRGTGGAFGP